MVARSLNRHRCTDHYTRSKKRLLSTPGAGSGCFCCPRVWPARVRRLRSRRTAHVDFHQPGELVSARFGVRFSAHTAWALFGWSTSSWRTASNQAENSSQAIGPASVIVEQLMPYLLSIRQLRVRADGVALTLSVWASRPMQFVSAVGESDLPPTNHAAGNPPVLLRSASVYLRSRQGHSRFCTAFADSPESRLRMTP